MGCFWDNVACEKNCIAGFELFGEGSSTLREFLSAAQIIKRGAVGILRHGDGDRKGHEGHINRGANNYPHRERHPCTLSFVHQN